MKPIAAFIIGMALAMWVTDSEIEARKYNEKHRTTLNTWDAMWFNLDDL